MAKCAPDERSKCLHCQTTVRFESPEKIRSRFRAGLKNNEVEVTLAICPECGKLSITVETLKNERRGTERGVQTVRVPSIEYVIWPKSSGRLNAPSDVPSHIAEDYDEAALILKDSSKASAALSRRCLQTVLKEAGKTESKDLADQIDEVLPVLPSHIADDLDFVRNVGNFGAHTQKSKVTGEILNVEPGEAEHNLNTLDLLFDFYYVSPAKAKAKREELGKKLKDAGKPPLKTK
ncbi:DUF4145 domain-containing protein [Bacteroidota bacterium]